MVDREQVAGDEHEPGGREERGEREHDRQDGGEERAEREQQDQDGDRDRQDLGV